MNRIEPSGRIVTDPFGEEADVTVNGSPSMSVSLASTRTTPGRSGSTVSASLTATGASIPVNPFNDSAEVVTAGTVPPSAVVGTAGWQYDEASADVHTTYSYETVLMDTSAANVSETMTALYRHQWLHTPDPLTTHTYQSPRGVMRLFEGSSFSTRSHTVNHPRGLGIGSMVCRKG